MLKHINLKNKRVPIPVPVRNLYEVLEWVSATFADDQKMITRVILDGQDIDLEHNDFKKYELSATNDLIVQVESPKDISSQSIEVIQTFCSVVLRRLKPLAVLLYQYKEHSAPVSLQEMMEDMNFIREIRAHLGGIVDRYHEDLAPFEALSILCEKVMGDLIKKVNNGEWTDCAEILLNRLEPFMRNLEVEIEILNSKLLSSDKILQAQINS